MNPLRKLAGQTVIYGLSTILPRFLNYLLVPLLTYKFTDPKDFGINTEIYAYISFLNIFFTYGMETAFFNFVNKTEDKRLVYSTALISVAVSTLLLTFIGILFSGIIASELNYPSNRNFIIWMFLIIGTDALMAIPFARLRSEQRPIRFALIKMINVFTNIALTVFFLHFCKNAFEQPEQGWMAGFYNPSIGIGYAFYANLIANFVSLLFLAPEFLGFPYVFDKALWNKMIRYALPLLIVGLAGMINETFDRIILKYLLPENSGQRAIGIYGACYKIAILMTIFIQAFKFAAEPFFFSNEKNVDAKKTNAMITKYFVISCAFIFLATMMNLGWIKFFVSEPYWEGLHVVPVLLMANLFLGVYYNLSIWYKLTEKTKYGAVITIVGAAITLFINFAFIPLYSYSASAWATFASYGAMMLLSYILGKKYYPIKYNLRSMLFFLFFATAFYFLSLIYRNYFSYAIELILNNLLLLLFAYLFYKFEMPNLKKMKNENKAG